MGLCAIDPLLSSSYGDLFFFARESGIFYWVLPVCANEKKRRVGGTYGMKIKTYEADVVVLNEEKGFAALKKAAESGRKLWDTEKIRVVIDKKVPPNSPEESKRQQEVLALARKLDIPHAYGRGMTSM